MAESQSHSGWLPPQPPGTPQSGDPPRFAPPAGARDAKPAETVGAAPAGPRGDSERPRFVKAGDAPQRPRSSGMATASVVLGVLALVLLVLSLGLAAIFSLGLATTGWTLATIDRRRARERTPGEPPPARAGRLLGITGVALSVAALIAWTLLFAAGANPQETLERWREQLEQQRQEQLQPGGADDQVEI